MIIKLKIQSGMNKVVSALLNVRQEVGYWAKSKCNSINFHARYQFPDFEINTPKGKISDVGFRISDWKKAKGEMNSIVLAALNVRQEVGHWAKSKCNSIDFHARLYYTHSPP